jgi:hypothetical protein
VLHSIVCEHQNVNANAAAGKYENLVVHDSCCGPCQRAAAESAPVRSFGCGPVWQRSRSLYASPLPPED